MTIHCVVELCANVPRADVPVTYYYRTSAGIIKVHCIDTIIVRSYFVEEDCVASPVPKHVKIYLEGTAFQKEVWRYIITSKPGTATTYQAVAHAIGSPTAHRAVARALAANKIAFFVPCHRVLRKDSSLGGYAWGIERKRMLLEAELHKR